MGIGSAAGGFVHGWREMDRNLEAQTDIDFMRRSFEQNYYKLP